MIFASVLQNEVAGGGVGASVVDESVGAAALEIFCLHVNRGGKFLLESDAPVEEARSLEISGVRSEGGVDRAASSRRGAVGICGEERVLASARKWTGDQEDGCGFVDDSDAGGEFRLAGVVENIGGGEAGSEIGVVDDVVPVEANAGFKKEAVGDAPAIFGVSGDFFVRQFGLRGGREGGVASAGELRALRSSDAEISGGQCVCAR